jgi:hypothetical protein
MAFSSSSSLCPIPLSKLISLSFSVLFSCFFFLEITLYPPEVSTHFHFCLQSLKCDTLPPQTFKLWQFNQFGLFIPKMPQTHFFFKKKNPKEKKRKKKEVAGHPNIYLYIFLVFFFFFRKKRCWGHFGNK